MMLWDIIHNNVPTLAQEIKNLLRKSIPDIDRILATELAEETGILDKSSETLTR